MLVKRLLLAGTCALVVLAVLSGCPKRKPKKTASAAPSAVAAAENPYRTGLLLPGIGIKELIIGKSTLADATKELGEGRITSVQKSQAYRPKTGTEQMAYIVDAYVEFPEAGLFIDFESVSKEEWLSADGDAAQRGLVKSNAEKFEIMYLNADFGRPGGDLKPFEGKTDRGLDRTSTRADVIRMYGQPVADKKESIDRYSLTYREGMIVSLYEPAAEPGKSVVEAVQLRARYSDEDLRYVR